MPLPTPPRQRRMVNVPDPLFLGLDTPLVLIIIKHNLFIISPTRSSCVVNVSIDTFLINYALNFTIKC